MFRFGIRDVLWLTVLVSVLVAWWLDHSRYKGERYWIDRFMKMQDNYFRIYPELSWVSRELKANGYAVEKDGRYWKMSPPLQPAQGQANSQ